jgi:uncharacterized membrane protein
MATLSVLKLNDPNGADRVLLAFQGMQERQVINLEDAAVVTWPEGRKKPQTTQLSSMAGTTALGGAFWGFLFGLIFFVPLLGMGVGAAAGWHLGTKAIPGIEPGFIEQVREVVTPGTSSPVYADQRGDGGQDDRGARAVRLRDHLDHPSQSG